MIKSLNNIQNLHYRTLIYLWQKKLVLRNHILILSVFSRESVYMHTDQREKIYDGSFWNCKGLKRKLPKVEHQHCTHIYIVPFANNQPFYCLTRFLSNSTMNNVCIYHVFTNKKYKLRALEAKIIMKVIQRHFCSTISRTKENVSFRRIYAGKTRINYFGFPTSSV